MTSWEPVIYSPASRIFEKESEALEWCIDQAETRVRDLSRQIFHAYDREADERAEQFPNEDDDLSNDSSGVEGHAGEQKCDDPTLLNPKPSTSGFQRAEMPSNARRSVTEPSENQASPAITPSSSPANVQPEGRGELLPFNLSDALAGKPVVTRDGREANGFRRRPNAHFSGYDYEVEVDNVWRSYKPDGRWMGKTDSIFDLFMLPTEGSGA